jgi:AraC family transcriptional activator of pobA
MPILNYNQQLPLYALEPDETGNKNFRMYNFEGSFPSLSDFLIPHRKDYYLFVFNRRGSNCLWIDMTPYVLKDAAVYFSGPGQIIVKEGFEQLWSTGIAFTKEFLSLQENASVTKLPIIRNFRDLQELLLTEADVVFIEDLLAKINTEYQNPGEWQQRMLAAHLAVLLTYLSRLHTGQSKGNNAPEDKLLLKNYQAKINERFRELHEVGDYAALLNISAGHLSEVVKSQSGKPAIKHIHEQLVLEARRLLFHTSNSLKEIAFGLGFSDASYFNRFFKRETGITPAEYRAAIRKMYHQYQ